MTTAKILAIAGSTRKDSFNTRLVRIAAAGAQKAGANVTVIDLKEFSMPIYDADLESSAGLPESVLRLQAIFGAHDGLLIASPEYNSSITPLLKNMIDWLSRPTPDQPGLAAFKDKFAVLMSASPGALGGLRGLVHVRSILSNIGVTVLADQFAVGGASDAFDSEGQLRDASKQEKVLGLGASLAKLLAKLKT